ncbi:hypothetical protein H2201_003642 [Coniosporium apollinis]|uniref:Major facilitator superfamily (MFS) profile domain-containing protein n=2 Tax=Coniosporium TaxID=2810619 RepID=A0ABQ9NW75_9PEZI|nr:hypothetical protein H2199_002816 [Cladosporium sp. JES 115]KAJ9666208.1 hypothetical protein H2201_003642 [Coniosporium apollinis]
MADTKESATSSPSPNHGTLESDPLANPAVEKQMRDIGADLYLEVQQYSAAELSSERAVVKRKLDLIIMPIICMTYTIQFLDKLSLNYASAYTLIPDLGLQGQRYSWVAAIFNFGYLFWAIPANLLIQRLPVAKYTGTMILVWSVLLIAHVGARNYAGALVWRFLLGMFEASISPAIMNIVSMFYTRSEQPLRMCIFLAFNGMATMLIFLVIGLMNFVWAWVFLYFMPDSPSSARFLTHKQKVIAIHRIAENMIGVKTKQFQWKQAVEAAYDVKVICLALVGLSCGVINGGVSNFASSLIKGYGCTWLQYLVGAPVILSWNLLTSNIAGHTKRSIANGLWFTFYAAGNIAGANIFFAREAPRYFSALTGLIVCYCGIFTIGLFLRQYMWWENRRRDRKMGVTDRTKNGADEQAIAEGFRDGTDLGNLHFRYCL